MSVNSYFVQYIESKISISENNNGEFSLLKYKGESSQTFHPVDFWDWFTQKIEYKNEFLSFVVLTDHEEFIVSKKIKISEINHFTKDATALNQIIEQASNLNIVSIPLMEKLKIEPQKVAKEITVDKKITINSNNNIANYFRKKTKSYKDE